MPRICAALIAGVLATACVAEQPAPCPDDWCGTAVIATPAEADVLFPPSAQGDIARSIIDLVFTRLADLGPDLNTVDPTSFEPRLASSWTREDSLTLVFSLNPDARWHDGAPLTAEDVAFTYEVYRDSLVGSPARPRVLQIAGVDVRDPYTIAFRFPRPYLEQLFDAVYHMWILPKHLLEAVPRGELVSHPFGRNPIGAGPYRFVQWRAGESVELVADSAYFLARPGLRRVIWRSTSGDMSAAITQLFSGSVDVLNYLPPEAVQRTETSDEVRAIAYQPSTFYSYLLFNFRDPADPTRPHPLFADRALRRALAVGVDRVAAVRAVDGADGIVADGPVSPALWIYGAEYERLLYDAARARRELTQLGWHDSDGDGVLDRNGRRLSFSIIVPETSAQRRRFAQIIQEQLKSLGVEMRITELDFNTFLQRAEAGRFDVFYGSYGGDPSPASISEVWTRDALGGFNFGSYVNPDVDRAVRAALDARDIETARRRWTDAVSLINADAPAIWISCTVPKAGVHRRFENVSIRGDNLTATLSLWRVPTDRRLPRDRYVN
jgi:peptide/nickel transport system substrate-binding protein